MKILHVLLNIKYSGRANIEKLGSLPASEQGKFYYRGENFPSTYILSTAVNHLRASVFAQKQSDLRT